MAKPIITPDQCRAGRALLGISQKALGALARIDPKTIVTFERGEHMPLPRTLLAIVATLDEAGVILLPAGDGRGVGVQRKLRVKAIRAAK